MSTSSRNAYHHGDLRRALIAAARELVGELGPAKVTLRAVAARAGVSAAAPYRHFASKEALLAAVAATGFDELADAITPPGNEDAVAGLHEIGFRYLDFAAGEPALYRFMFGPAVPDRRTHADLAVAERRLADVFAAAVHAAQKTGRLTALAADDVMLTLRCAMHGLASLVVDGQIPARHAVPATKRIQHVIDTGLMP